LETLINGVQSESISIRDRGLQYGDGCFETLRVCNHFPILLEEHLQRLLFTCQRLRLAFDVETLRNELTNFVQQCSPDGVIKIIITRGIGGRGYAATNAENSNRLLMYSPLPDSYPAKSEEGVHIGVSEFTLAEGGYFAGLKHLNRLEQVMASFDIDASMDEVLCLDQHQHVIEGTKSNLVLALGNKIVTPSLDKAGVKGVMLDFLRRRFAEDGQTIKSRELTLANVRAASELFLCNSVFGVWPVRKMSENAKVNSWSVGPVTQQAMRYHHEIMQLAD